ncbi:hypothetical protein [Aquiflexum sp.]|uniref:hypothetical protein n=1 Tax=Aquiflexum sp. TaxID=1872584 RepID=UPI0035931E78
MFYVRRRSTIRNLMTKFYKGEIYNDKRGTLTAFNDFSLVPIKRMYSILLPDTQIVRAWQGHKKESKWFYVTHGIFAIAIVEIDDFDNPSKELMAEYFIIKASENSVLQIPNGFANGLKALEPNSKVAIFSDLTLDEAKNDNFKFESKNWLNWDKL